MPPSSQKSTKFISRRSEENATDSGSDLSSVPPPPLLSTGEKDQLLSSRKRKDNDHKYTHIGNPLRDLKPFGNCIDQEKEDLLSARRSNFSFFKCAFQLNRYRIDCKQQCNFLFENIRKYGHHQNERNKNVLE